MPRGIRRLGWLLVHFLLLYFFRARSLFVRLKYAFSKKENVHLYTDVARPEKILVMAVRQDGRLRNDLIRVLSIAKEQNFYVIVVNTSRIDSENTLNDLCDCYVEKYDFGRYFGSYKSALMFVYKNGLDKNCQRLVILNDSVFYSKRNLPLFLEKLGESRADVLGATENHDFEYHIGSFCISVSGRVLRDRRFFQYWSSYAPTAVRPDTIKRGEMALSRVLRKIAKDNIRIMYDLLWFSNYVEADEEVVDDAFKYSRRSERTGVPTLTSELYQLIERRSAFPLEILPEEGFLNSYANVKKKKKIPVLFDNSTEAEAYEDDIENQRERYIRQFRQNFRQIKKEILLKIFPRGSQIHQNALILFKGGLPIVKLDLLYRGVLDKGDVSRLAAMMDPDDAEEFKKLVFARPFGGHHLFGLQRIYFHHSFI